MILEHLQILIIIVLIRYGFTQSLFDQFMPGVKKYRFHSNAVRYRYVPLYITKGPDPMDDYMMVNRFRPRKMVKRFRNPLERMKRQVNEEDQFKDLLESFGGMSETSSSTTERPNSKENDAMSNRNPKNGFYYFLDWNSFLEIDDQKGRRVNLRIQPKFGDPKRFFSVSVP